MNSIRTGEAAPSMRRSARNDNSRKDRKASRLSPALLLLTVMTLGVIAFAIVGNQRRPFFPKNTSSALPVSTPPTLPSSAPAREYVYAGGSLISTIEPYRPPSSDIAVWRPANGTWYILNEQSQVITGTWGMSGDIPVPGDFDGDGKTDFSIYRPSQGTWYIYHSTDGSYDEVTWGIAGSGDIPAVGDYDGDGKCDFTIFRPSNGNWYILKSSNSQFDVIQWGASTDKPVPADYDGDGKTDVAVWKEVTTPSPSTWAFFVLKSTDGGYFVSSGWQGTDEPTGANGRPISADYDGDGKADYAVRRAGTGGVMDWVIGYSSGGSATIPWGNSTDQPVPARYNESADSDAKADIAVWRPSNATWYIRKSSDAGLVTVQWGNTGDIPVPSNWNR